MSALDSLAQTLGWAVIGSLLGTCVGWAVGTFIAGLRK